MLLENNITFLQQSCCLAGISHIPHGYALLTFRDFLMRSCSVWDDKYDSLVFTIRSDFVILVWYGQPQGASESEIFQFAEFSKQNSKFSPDLRRIMNF